MSNQLYGIDTVALLAYLTDNLGPKGTEIFSMAESLEATLLIPEVVLGETVYTILKGREIFGNRIDVKTIETIIETIHSSPMFVILSLTRIGWKIFLSSRIHELHDRMIVAACLQENVEALITRDDDILNSGEIPCVW